MQALQEESSSLQEPASIMQIQIHSQRDEIFFSYVEGSDVIAMYVMGACISCMSYTYYEKLKSPPSLKIVPVMSMHLAIGNDLCPISLSFESYQ